MSVRGGTREPIAIIGIGCRLPGASDPESFWSLLKDGKDAVGEYAGGRFPDLDAFYERAGTVTGPITRRGGFLSGLDKFDADFFAISPREAEFLDPQQRLLLEIAWETFEDAGQSRDRYRGTKAGVFVGVWATDYETAMHRATNSPEFLATTGGAAYAVSGRVAYNFDLRGPNVTLNAACSTSLVAIHQACNALWTEECPMALAGGANVVLASEITQAYSSAKILSPDGRCKFGDSSANGFVRSEGAALVLLKRLPDALADGDRVYAVIRGTSTNNDGASGGSLVRPSQSAQEQMLRDAFRSAGVSAADLHYIEAHGTGTRAGDQVELSAIANVMLESGRQDACLLGSAKSNVGHTEAAAGVTGLIKTALSLHHGFVPKTLHVRELTPAIDWERMPVRLQLQGAAWPSNRKRIAGVSAFGITGTNAHVVLEEAPVSRPRAVSASREQYLLPITAASPEALTELLGAYAAQLRGQADSLHDICYTAARRSLLEHRCAVLAKSPEEALDAFEALQRGEQPSTVAMGQAPGEKKLKVAFVFPGQGSQWAGMGRELFQSEPVFRSVIEAVDQHIRREAGWSLIEQIQNPERESNLTEINIVQPTLFAIEVALARLWQSWGIEAAAVVGHSMGEVAAAHVAGALSLSDAVHIICTRSALMRQVSGHGEMAMVELSVEQAAQAIRGREAKLSVAVSNSPRSTVVSGDSVPLRELIAELEKKEIFCRLIKVDVASHSAHMDPLTRELRAALGSVRPHIGSIPIQSTVLGESIDGSGCDADYWIKNLRSPVLFCDAVQALLGRGFDAFIEMSPQPILLPAIEQGCDFAGIHALGVPSMRRNEPEAAVMLAGLARLFVAGARVHWNTLYGGGTLVDLPHYPWQRQRFWFDPPAGKIARLAEAGSHALLGSCLTSASGERVWTNELSTNTLSWLRDHALRGSAVLPASAYVDMALAAGANLPGGQHDLKDLKLLEAISIPAETTVQVQTVIAPEPDGDSRIRIFHRVSASSDWSVAASGVLTTSSPVAECAAADFVSDAVLKTPGKEHDALMARLGYQFGPKFQCVDWYVHGKDEAFAQLNVPEGLETTTSLLHPALLDAGFQVLGGLRLKDAEPGALFLPVGVESAEIFSSAAGLTTLSVHAILTDRQRFRGDVYYYHPRGELLAVIRGLAFHPVENRGDELGHLLYGVEWQSAVRSGPAVGRSSWLILSDRGAIGSSIARLLEQRDDRCLVVEYEESFSIERVRKSLLFLLYADTPAKGILDLRGLGAQSAEAACFEVTQVIQALAETEIQARVCVVTRGACPAGRNSRISPAQASLWGLGSVIVNEYPEVHCTCIDLDPAPLSSEVQELEKEITCNSGENQIALRSGARFVPRLQAIAARPEEIRKPAQRDVASGEHFALQLPATGLLEGFELQARQPSKLGMNDVEIEVRFSGLNFRDVVIAMGMDPSAPSTGLVLGIECSGVVTRTGAGVSAVRPGDEVMALTPSCKAVSMFVSHAVIPAELVVKKPARASLEEAAGIPAVFLTGWYSLVHKAKLRAGERVLIHAGTGGVGLAAIQIAKWIGAEIFATAGSEEKRQYLREVGVQHVFDSRTLEFADQIREATGGRGVDVVLNSLAGPAIARGLSALAPFGRFVEIGKRDMWQDNRIGLQPFLHNLSFFGVDIAAALEQRRDLVSCLLSEICEAFDQGVLHPLPITAFPVSSAAEAFHHMAQAKHIGKIVLNLSDPEAKITSDASLMRTDGTYLITGGLGALGLTAARDLAQLGARDIVLTGRSAPSGHALDVIEGLKQEGVRVHVARVDVSQEEDVRSLLEHIEQSLPPLRGVVHSAGILDDALIADLTPEHFARVMAGKSAGALLLDRLTEEMPLDFFILYSSVAALLGSAGQGNYAAANAVLDALAHDRRARGLPATSINWGPWSEIGLAAAQSNRGQRIGAQGLGSISRAEGSAVLRKILTDRPVQVAAMRFDAPHWKQEIAGAAQNSLLAGMQAGSPTQASSKEPEILEQLSQAAPEHAAALMRTHVASQVSVVLRMDPMKVPGNKPLRVLGLDSLMSLELRNRLERSLHLKLSAALIWNYPTVEALSGCLYEKLGLTKRSMAASASAGDGARHNGHGPSAEDLLAAELAIAEDALNRGNS